MAGNVIVDHHQFALGVTTADTLAISEQGGLLEVGIGFVTIMTGIAYGPLSVTIERLDRDPGEVSLDDWEVVEEATLSARKPLHVMRLDGELESGFDPIPAGKYRVRAQARGRDSDYDLDVTESGGTAEEHLLRLWPIDSVRSRKIRQLRKIDEAYSPVENPWDKIDQTRLSVFDSDGGTRWVPFEGPEHLALRQRMHDFLADPANSGLDLADERVHASYIAIIDPDMNGLIASLSVDRQREFSLWCVERAFERAGLADLPWVREGLEALRWHTPLPRVWQQPHLVQYEVHKDRTAIRKPAVGKPGFGGTVPADRAASAYSAYVRHRPLSAALQCFDAAADTYGMDYLELSAAARREFFGINTTSAELFQKIWRQG